MKKQIKKIGITTFHNALNYGAMLQVFALENILKNHNVEVIDFENSEIKNKYKLFRKLDNFNKKNIKVFINDLIYLPKNLKRKKSFENFCNTKLKISEKRYINDTELKKANLPYDIMITGSDQVWNIGITNGLSDIYTLNFGKENVKRISYAASVGEAKLILENADEYKNKLCKIDYISVREDDAGRELEKVLNREIVTTLDPTLLLKRDEWDMITQTDNSLKNGKYILAYFIEYDEEYIKIVEELRKKTGLPIICFEKNCKNYKKAKTAYTEGPLEFVDLIKNAEYVVATSFHATVFSIIFNKNFFIVPHKKTGSRVTNLLDKLGIEGRIFNTKKEFEKINYDFKTDWDSVNKKLDEERKKSLKWLMNIIEE